MKCRACGHENIDGVDRCEECMEPFRDQDVPRPKGGLQARIMLDPIGQLCTPNPASVVESDTISHAVEVMKSRHAGCVLVLQEGKLKGILTEFDLLFKLAGREHALDRIFVSELMTPNAESVDEDCSIAYALNMMSVGGYRHLPVIRDDRVVGILSIKDLFAYLKKQLL
jgi:CBS domain-containing protein